MCGGSLATFCLLIVLAYANRLNNRKSFWLLACKSKLCVAHVFRQRENTMLARIVYVSLFLITFLVGCGEKGSVYSASGPLNDVVEHTSDDHLQNGEVVDDGDGESEGNSPTDENNSAQPGDESNASQPSAPQPMTVPSAPSPVNDVDADQVQDQESVPAPVVVPNVQGGIVTVELLKKSCGRRNHGVKNHVVASFKMTAAPTEEEVLIKSEELKRLLRTGWGNMVLAVTACNDSNGDKSCLNEQSGQVLFKEKLAKLRRKHAPDVEVKAGNLDLTVKIQKKQRCGR